MTRKILLVSLRGIGALGSKTMRLPHLAYPPVSKERESEDDMESQQETLA